MKCIESFTKLKLLLEGKSISELMTSDDSTAICKFILTDGSSFTLCATELGFWIKEMCDSTGYISLTGLLNDYELNTDDDHICDIQISNDLITFINPINNNKYVIDKKYLTDWELKILLDPKGKEILAKNACNGYMWKYLFTLDCKEQNINHLEET